MSDKFIKEAEAIDQKVRRDKVEEVKYYDTKRMKFCERPKTKEDSNSTSSIADKAYLKPGKLEQIMFERLEEGLHTKIPKENKGYQLLMKLGFKEGQKTLGKKPQLDEENVSSKDSESKKVALEEPLKPHSLKPTKRGIDF